MAKRTFDIGTLCDIGYVKRSNQDSILIKIGEDAYGEFGLFVVADGMGGLAHGDFASQLIVSECKQWWEQKLPLILIEQEEVQFGMINTGLTLLVEEINKKIFDHGNRIGEKIGSTLSLLLIHKNTYIIKHIGDSRIYLINGDFEQLTEDHSLVAQQVREGKITKEEAKNHPQRNVLTRCLGVFNNIELFESSGYLADEDSFFLCSDGLHNFVTDGEILEAMLECKVNREIDPQDKALELLDKVKERGAGDNISVIMLIQRAEKKKKTPFERIREMLHR